MPKSENINWSPKSSVRLTTVTLDPTLRLSDIDIGEPPPEYVGTVPVLITITNV